MNRPDEIVAANDQPDVVDLLIKAHAICSDSATRDLIELALLHEGRKISSKLKQSERSA